MPRLEANLHHSTERRKAIKILFVTIEVCRHVLPKMPNDCRSAASGGRVHSKESKPSAARRLQRLLDGLAGLSIKQLWIIEVCIVHDDVCPLSGATQIQVPSLTRHIPPLVFRLNRRPLICPGSVAVYRSGNGHTERSLNPKTNVPHAGKLGPLKEHTVKKENGIARRSLVSCIYGPVSPIVEHRLAELPRPSWTKRIKKPSSQYWIVEGIEKIPLCRILAARVPERPWSVKAVDGCKNNLPPSILELLSKLSSQSGFTHAVHTIDSDSGRVSQANAGDRLRQFFNAVGSCHRMMSAV
ncbi:MAG: hypothetical protein WC815_21505 [Vicinamibacterales bacterium]|jgi:hypothetical protein